MPSSHASPVIPITCILLVAATGSSCQCREQPVRTGVTFTPSSPDRSANAEQSSAPAHTAGPARAAHARAHAPGARAHPMRVNAASASVPSKLSEVSLGLHLQRATAVRITRLQPGSDDAPMALGMWSLTDRKDVAAMRAAIGVEQRASDEQCQPCARATRVVFEDPMGLHLAEIQLDCPAPVSPEAAVEGTGVQVRLGAHPLCGRIALRDRSALTALIARAQSQGKSRVPVALP